VTADQEPGSEGQEGNPDPHQHKERRDLVGQFLHGRFAALRFFSQGDDLVSAVSLPTLVTSNLSKHCLLSVASITLASGALATVSYSPPLTVYYLFSTACMYESIISTPHLFGYIATINFRGKVSKKGTCRKRTKEVPMS
jgi:hypothetical protein